MASHQSFTLHVNDSGMKATFQVLINYRGSIDVLLTVNTFRLFNFIPPAAGNILNEYYWLHGLITFVILNFKKCLNMYENELNYNMHTLLCCHRSSCLFITLWGGGGVQSFFFPSIDACKNYFWNIINKLFVAKCLHYIWNTEYLTKKWVKFK